jgi:hypothetical protein
MVTDVCRDTRDVVLGRDVLLSSQHPCPAAGREEVAAGKGAEGRQFERHVLLVQSQREVAQRAFRCGDPRHKDETVAFPRAVGGCLLHRSPSRPVRVDGPHNGRAEFAMEAKIAAVDF